MKQDSYRIVRTESSNIEELARDMREADVKEVYATAGVQPLEALKRSVAVTPECFSAVDKWGTFAVWGIGECMGEGIGSPWMLGADRLVTTHRRSLLEVSRRFVNEAKSKYEVLVNWVDARNSVSIRWLEWCGFTIFGTEPFGFLKLPFHRFEFRRGI